MATDGVNLPASTVRQYYTKIACFLLIAFILSTHPSKIVCYSHYITFEQLPVGCLYDIL